MMYAIVNKYDNVRRFIICDNNPCMAAVGHKEVYYKNHCYEFVRATDIICCNEILYIHANNSCLFRISDQRMEMIFEAVGKRNITFKVLLENEFLFYYNAVINNVRRFTYVKDGITIWDIVENNFYPIKELIVSVQEDKNSTLFVAFDIHTPEQTWRFTIPDGDKLDRFFVLEHNLLVFITQNRWLFALEATSGNLVWKTKAKFRIYHYNPANLTLFGIGGSYLEVFDFMTGRLIHSADLTTAFAPYDMHLLSHMGTVVGDYYYFVHNAQKNLVGHLDIQSGTLQHIQVMEGQGKPWVLIHPPVVHNNHLYILTTTEVLYDFAIVK